MFPHSLLSTLLTFLDSISAFGECGQVQWLQTTLAGFSEGQQGCFRNMHSLPSF